MALAERGARRTDMAAPPATTGTPARASIQPDARRPASAPTPTSTSSPPRRTHARGGNAPPALIMAPSSWENWPNHERDKWRDYLRNIDFWFNGYYEKFAYSRLVVKLLRPFHVCWNVGVGPMASFTRAISGLTVKEMPKFRGGFNPVIKVDLKPTPTAEEAQGRGIMSTKYQLAIAAAKELGQLDQRYNRLKEKHDDLQYYTYGCDDGGTSQDLEWHVPQTIVPQIIQQLLTKRYLLVVENLEWPIEPGSLTVEGVGLPPPSWAYSQWLISATSRDVYNKSKSQDDRVISILSDDLVVVLIIYAMHQSAEHIHSVMHQGSKEYWHRISLDCFHYAMTLFVGHSQVVDVTSEELIHQWATQGVIPQPHMTIKEDEETNTISSKCSHMHRVGRVILEAFHKYSLLQLPFSPATEAYEASNTGAQFFLYHDLIAESITLDELFDNKKKWISFNGDHGWHDMSNLEELILTSCSNLVELPPSMASLSSLTTLVVIGTRIKYFPRKIFEEMQKLQSLKLIDNKNLVSLTRQISRVQRIKLEGHPSLISFMLIGAPHIRHLSLRGCKKLESIEIKNLGALEELDLSGTAIKELPADIPNIPQLRRLLLVGVPSLRRFPWHRLDRLPAVFYLDHCSEENGNHCNQISHVCVTDPKFFHSFRNTVVNLVRAGRFLQSFYVRVAPCTANSMHLQDEEGMLNSMLQELVKKESTYVDVYGRFYADEIAMVSPVTIPLRRSERHMEITGKQSTLDGLSSLEHLHLEDCPRLEHVVPHTATLPCLKTIDIVFCYNLKTIFFSSHTEDDTYYQLPSLQRIRLQELPLLQHFHYKDATITAPVWNELHVRGCWSLRRLPRLLGRQPETVKVNGERSWWSKLQWGSPLHRDNYDPKLPPEFASFDERAEMSSYLR
ncbi:hypothetical protein ZWY2020_055082 [Hordeum vulgare]|nr:hypothetical protein ZWY2020_055082 [Hordeum vulgare]